MNKHSEPSFESGSTLQIKNCRNRVKLTESSHHLRVTENNYEKDRLQKHRNLSDYQLDVSNSSRREGIVDVDIKVNEFQQKDEVGFNAINQLQKLLPIKQIQKPHLILIQELETNESESPTANHRLQPRRFNTKGSFRLPKKKESFGLEEA